LERKNALLDGVPGDYLILRGITWKYKPNQSEKKNNYKYYSEFSFFGSLFFL
jgi:hypothetical protein